MTGHHGGMKLAFALPHTLELPAITAGWEFAVTGPQQAAMVKRAAGSNRAQVVTNVESRGDYRC